MKLDFHKHFSVSFIIALLPLLTNAGYDKETAGKDSGISEFHLSISEHYKVGEEDIVLLQKRNIPEEELPVVFHIAEHLGVESLQIATLRIDGLTWHDICTNYAISPEIFFVELNKKPGPPYGRGYGKYYKLPQRNWREIYLSDADVINWTNLKFAVDYYTCDPELIVEMRSDGRGFREIHTAVTQNCRSDNKQANADKEMSDKQDKGKSQKK